MTQPRGPPGTAFLGSVCSKTRCCTLVLLHPFPAAGDPKTVSGIITLLLSSARF